MNQAFDIVLVHMKPTPLVSLFLAHEVINEDYISKQLGFKHFTQIHTTSTFT